MENIKIVEFISSGTADDLLVHAGHGGSHKAERSLLGHLQKWKFDLIDRSGQVVGGGFVVALTATAALGHAILLSGNNTPRIRDLGNHESEQEVAMAGACNGQG
jgi:hypothetical protein